MNQAFLIVISVLFSAFFSGLEIAFISSNKLRFELDKKQRNFTSSILSIFYKHPQQYISTMLVGNNISLVIYGLLMADALMPYFSMYITNQLVITLLQTIVASALVLLTGEFIPKTIFRINPNLWLKIFSPIILVFYIVLYPITKFASALSILILRIFGVKIEANISDNVFSRVDLTYLIQSTIDNPESTQDIDNEVKIFQNALDFSKVKLRDCYIPRTEIVALEYDTDTEVLKQTFIESGLSKIPIYKANIDNVIGYIHSSEMFKNLENWRNTLRDIPIVPENMAAQKLMKLFMNQKKSIAVVVDEFGGTAGIITLEDIIEEIFGEIEDEHDSRGYVAEKIGNNEYLFSGRLEVESINSRFNISIPESDAYDTIAGFILHHHRHFPKVNEVLQIEGFSIKCVKATSNRIELIRLAID